MCVGLLARRARRKDERIQDGTAIFFRDGICQFLEHPKNTSCHIFITQFVFCHAQKARASRLIDVHFDDQSTA